MALRVLLADSSDSIRRVVQLALQDFGVQVKTIGHAIDVLEVARSWKPDIVLVDILLQKQSGYAVAQAVKDDPALSAIPVVLMWSGFMDFDEAKAKSSKAEGRLEKPFDSDALRALMIQFVPRLRQHPLSPFLNPVHILKTDTEAWAESNSPEAWAESNSDDGPRPPEALGHEEKSLVEDTIINFQPPHDPKKPTAQPGPMLTPAPQAEAPLNLQTPDSVGTAAPPKNWNMDSFDPVPPLELVDLELEVPVTPPAIDPGDPNFFQDYDTLAQHAPAAFVDPIDLNQDEPEEFSSRPLAPLKDLSASEIIKSPAPPESLSDPFGGSKAEIQDADLNVDLENDWQRQDIQTFQLDIPEGAEDGAAVISNTQTDSAYSKVRENQIPTDASPVFEIPDLELPLKSPEKNLARPQTQIESEIESGLTPSVKPPTQSTPTIHPSLRTQPSIPIGQPPFPNHSIPELQPHQVEEFIHAQSEAVIREIALRVVQETAQRMIPEIATDLIRKEIQRLLDESVSS